MDTASGEARFDPLRAPHDRTGVIRVAYAVPTCLVAEGARSWLELSDGGRIELPSPVEGTGRMRDGDPFADAPDPVPAEEPPSAFSEPDARSLEVPADDGGGDPLELLGDSEAQIRSLAQQVTELERARDEDRRVAAADAAQAEGRALSAEEREAAAEARAQTAEQAIQVAEARVAALEADLAAEAPAREALRAELSSLQSRRRSLERELDQSRDQLRIMAFERDELERQAQAFDAVAIKARERAAAVEAAHGRTTSTLDELQIWRAELERRLADTTTELGALRAGRDADERELVRLRAALAEHEHRGGPPGADGGGFGAGDNEIVAVQAEEIQRLAAELAELRSRVARGG